MGNVGQSCSDGVYALGSSVDEPCVCVCVRRNHTPLLTGRAAIQVRFARDPRSRLEAFRALVSVSASFAPPPPSHVIQTLSSVLDDIRQPEAIVDDDRQSDALHSFFLSPARSTPVLSVRSASSNTRLIALRPTVLTRR